MVIDLLPAGKRDPRGIHNAIWNELAEEEDEPADEKPLVFASYDAGPPPVAYVESVGVGEELPELPLFLRSEFYVPAPLEETYRATREVFPNVLKRLLS